MWVHLPALLAIEAVVVLVRLAMRSGCDITDALVFRAGPQGGGTRQGHC